MHAILQHLEQHAVVPAIVLDDAAHAAPLAEALIEGRLPCAEVTLRTPASLEALKAMSAYSDQLIVGAGTVMSIAQADEAIAAGARFLVSPGMDAGLIHHCMEKGIPIIPGACTPTEVMLAVNLGLECVKFFPAGAYGGLPVLKALHGPFPDMRFMPTGGMSLEMLPDYLSFRPVLAVGGTWMVKREWLSNERFDVISDACLATVEAVALARRSRALASRGA
ncbi:MAG: bifunctional 4-hydroxy-2-oxoglutarate aldolase/2-dehydro-3-deoxy-phosphogluconate aldolase [Roseimicrobium sp.]